MKSSCFAVSIFFAAIASTFAARDPGEAFLEQRFKQLDADADGKLSVEEAKSVAELIRGADTNKDGFFTLDEVREHFVRRLTALIPARNNEEDAAKLGDPPAPMYAPPADSPREAARALKPAECGIGTMIPEMTVTDLDGATHSLRALQGGKPLLIALVSTSCPVSKRYLPSLGRLAQESATRGVASLLVASTLTDSPEELREALKANGLSVPCIRDKDRTLLKTLGARATADIFLVDAAHTLVYRGAIDDQYGLGYSLEAPRARYAAAAIDAMLAGRAPSPAATEAPGCVLDLGEAKAAPVTPVTYHNHISRLVQANCLECHRAGGVAPFPLETFEQVDAKAGMIRKMVERSLMPPWFAAPPAPGEHSPWGNDRALSAGERTVLLGWLNGGRPVGDPADAPKPRTFSTEWQIGTPDAVVQIPQPIEVKAEGTMPYQMVTVATNLTEDKWVRGFEVSPTAREVVHHVIVFVRSDSPLLPRRPKVNEHQDESSGMLAAYVPGNDHVIYPDGFAKPLPAGSRLLFQIHYTPNGTATRDQVRIGLLFAKAPPRHVVEVIGVANHRLSIPPGADAHPVSASIPVPAAAHILALMPHMHVRGKAFRYELVQPDGAIRTLLDVPRYDFNWQLSYRYAEPAPVAAGSRIRVTGWFDNSTNNPANPDPTRTVRWGLQTIDEMMLGYIEYYLDGAAPVQTRASR
jgi:peroxiredoxin